MTSISVLLPTRKRTTALDTSLSSLINNVENPSEVEYLLGFDDDDQETIAWCKEHIVPKLEASGSKFTILEFERMGYTRLNEYVNQLAHASQGSWLMFWNDDAIMHTKGWDSVIKPHTGSFNVLRMPTHNCHPYAIFPIVPKQWYELFGYLSAHQISDAWISQIAYLVDIMVTIPIEVTHDRHDLTGNNKDETFQERIMFEGRHEDPRDFNHTTWRQRRMNDAAKIARYIESTGSDASWFRNVCAGKQDPWAKMMDEEHDPNKQLASVKTKKQ